MKRKIIMISCLLFAFLLMGMTEAEAKTARVAKVSIKHVVKDEKQRAVIIAKDSSGKVVWKYTTKGYEATELAATTMKAKGNKVYIFENGKMIVFNKQTGRKIVSTKRLFHGFQAGFVIDSSGNCYIQPYYTDIVYKVSAKGKVLWKRNMKKTKLYWPGKMKIRKDAVRIYYDGESPSPYMDVTGKYIDFDKKKGKILEYKGEDGIIRRNDDLSIEEAGNKVKEYENAYGNGVVEYEYEDEKYYYYVLGWDNGYSVVFSHQYHYRVHKRTGKIKKIKMY